MGSRSLRLSVLVASALPMVGPLAFAGCAGDVTGSSDESGLTDAGTGGGADARGEIEEADADPGDSSAVSMSELVLQAQVEPFRGDQPDLRGNAAVKEIQRALVEEGFDVGVDGWFGNETAGAYSDWQTSLGYSGLGANGIPGPTSLEALAEGRFVIDDMIDIGSRTTYTSRTVNQRTRDMLAAADALLAHDIVLSQGSYNAGGVGASAGTHDGGGAVDISVSALSTTQRWETVKALRTVGFAAWLRSPSQGPWPYHIHAIAIGDTDLSISARNQVADYFVGKNGLASHAPDDTPSKYRAPFTSWETYQGQ